MVTEMVDAAWPERRFGPDLRLWQRLIDVEKLPNGKSSSPFRHAVQLCLFQARYLRRLLSITAVRRRVFLRTNANVVHHGQGVRCA